MSAQATRYRRPEAAAFEQRTEPRLRLSIKRASVRRHGNAAVEALLHDLSIYGCRLATPAATSAGERLWLRFDGQMPIAATVVWGAEGMVGCRFDEPIERSVMRALTLRIA